MRDGAGGRPPLPRARKRFAQHFLTDPRILGRIADALAPDASSTVLEIGPGRGALTAVFAERAGRVIAIEIDRDLVKVLRERFGSDGTVQIEEGDALEAEWQSLAGRLGPVDLLVANLRAGSLARRLAAGHPHLKFVYISEFSDDAGEYGRLPAGAAVLQKPFRLDALLEKIRTVLDNHRASDQEE